MGRIASPGVTTHLRKSRLESIPRGGSGSPCSGEAGGGEEDGDSVGGTVAINSAHFLGMIVANFV